MRERGRGAQSAEEGQTGAVGGTGDGARRRGAHGQQLGTALLGPGPWHGASPLRGLGPRR